MKKEVFLWRSRIQRQLKASRPLVAALEEIALKYQATAAQVALNWLIWFKGGLMVTIPGATKTQQAVENAGPRDLDCWMLNWPSLMICPAFFAKRKWDSARSILA